MKIKKTLLKIAGKEDLELDSRISTSYLIGICINYVCMLIRGMIFSIFRKNISKKIFVGAKVKVLNKKCLKVGSYVKLHDGVYIDALSTNGVRIGNKVVIGRNSRIECTGSLSHLGKGVSIGDRTTFGSDCYFGAAGGIDIGDDVVAGQNIRFHSENHNFNDLNALIKDQGVTHKGIQIGHNCWIGAGAVFLDGAELEDGCVVAANAVVTKRFPENSVVAGVPARVIRTRG